MVNNILHQLWIKHFLKRLGRKYPDFVSSMINDLVIHNKAKSILKLRYIERKSWDEISDTVFLSKSRVMQLHKTCIEIFEDLSF